MQVEISQEGPAASAPQGLRPRLLGPSATPGPPGRKRPLSSHGPTHRATLRGFCLLPAPCPRCPPGPAASPAPAPAPPSICVPRSTMPPRLWCWPRPCPPTCSRWSPWRSLGTPGTQGHQEEEEEAGRGRGSPHSHHASTTTAAAAASAAVRTGAQQCLWPGPASQWGVGTSRPSTASPRGAVTLQPSRCHGAALDLMALAASRRGVVTSRLGTVSQQSSADILHLCSRFLLRGFQVKLLFHPISNGDLSGCRICL